MTKSGHGKLVAGRYSFLPHDCPMNYFERSKIQNRQKHTDASQKRRYITMLTMLTMSYGRIYYEK